MNPKILLAFLGGAVLASGIVYMAVKPDTKPPTKTVYVEPAPPQATPAKAADAAPVEQKSPVVAEVTQPAPIEQKHAPAHVERHRTARKQAPVEMAKEIPPPAPIVQPAPVTPPPQPAPEPVQAAPAPESAPPPPPEPHSVTLIAGTSLPVRIGETLNTQRNKIGDTFTATLDQPLVIDGFVIAEKGARCEGRVVESDPGGKVKGVAHMEVELTRIHTADGQRITVHTASFGQDAPTTRKTDAAKVGGGAALGAIIGALAGGGKGAGIGAAAGGAAGAGDVMLTRGKPAEIRVETRVTFRVQDPITITEKLQ
jgi:hypothetical protein